MRYILIDRITALVPGHSLDAIKHVRQADDLVSRDAAGRCALPAAMVLEAMAQAAGLLVAASLAVPAQPVLAKVQPFTAYGDARPGDAVAIRAELGDHGLVRVRNKQNGMGDARIQGMDGLRAGGKSVSTWCAKSAQRQPSWTITSF